MESLNVLARHVNECEVRREKYTLPDLVNAHVPQNQSYIYPALREPPIFTEPLECTWAFMQQDEVEVLLKMKNFGSVKAAIETKLSRKYPKALPKIIAVELLYGGFKFAKTLNYKEEQVGALLSMLYMTHRYFNSSHRTTAEDIYWVFKELLCYHSLDFAPSHKKVFAPEEAQIVLGYFCKIFLRHLPIIRLLGLPNFELAINTYIPPFPVFKKKKEKLQEDAKKSNLKEMAQQKNK